MVQKESEFNGIGILEDEALLESSGDEDEDLNFQMPHETTEEAARNIVEHQTRLLQKLERIKQNKRKLQGVLAAYEQKENAFVSDMDAHMEEVERTEHDLGQRIQTLQEENTHLRNMTDKKARENQVLADKLSDTTKHCSESETRVQFLVDRIVALLSAGSADRSQTDAVLKMRQQEREMLKQLEETRNQFDEVRRQNGELTSRLTEELALSRRLQDQLAEIEDRFFHHSTQHPCREAAGPRPSPPTPNNGPGDAGCLYSRPLGLRSDQAEAPPERERTERPSLPDLPPVINEAEEQMSQEPHLENGASGQGEEGHMDLPQMAETGHLPLSQADAPPFQEMGDLVGLDEEARDQAMISSSALGSDADGDVQLTRVPNGTRNLQTIWTSSPRSGVAHTVAGAGGSQPSQTFTGERPVYSRTTSAEAVLLMEQKLRDALDFAAFECAVVRVESGVYDFGRVRAVLELDAESNVVASHDGGPFEPIDDFINGIAHEGGRMQSAYLEKSGDDAPGSFGQSLPQLPSIGSMPLSADNAQASSDPCMPDGSQASQGRSELGGVADMGSLLGSSAPSGISSYVRQASPRGPISSQSPGRAGVQQLTHSSGIASPALANTAGQNAVMQHMGAASTRSTSPTSDVNTGHGLQLRTSQTPTRNVRPTGPHSAAAGSSVLQGHVQPSVQPERARTPGRPTTASPAAPLQGQQRLGSHIAQQPSVGNAVPNQQMLMQTNATNNPGAMRIGVAVSPGRRLMPQR